MALRVIFMGTPEFGLPALEAIHASNHKIIAVYTQPPRPGNRLEIKKSPVHQWAEDHNIPVFTPMNFKDSKDIETFKNLNADLAVVAAYGLLLPREILDAQHFGCINIHASTLPRWRGAAPIQGAILEGDKTTSVTIMKMDEGLDTGDVIYPGTPIEIGTQTAGELHDLLAVEGGDIIVAAINDVTSGKIKPVPQNHSKATHAPKIKKEDARINWSKGAGKIERMVRAFNPHPGAFFEFDGKRFKVLEGAIEEQKGAPGAVLDERLLIGTGDAAYRILKIQREGKGPMGAEDFLRGFTLPRGSILS